MASSRPALNGHLDPRSALDVGCGEGVDAIWPAKRGLGSRLSTSPPSLSGVGLSTPLVPTSRFAQRSTWQLEDLTQWTPVAGSNDLVSTQFMHLVGG